MSTYRLDETPNTYLSGVVKDGSYIFRMNHIEEESNSYYLRDIDLRNDKLIVYGTEINDSNREKLHNSLILRPDVGKLCVNCNGACFIYFIEKKAYYRLIDNVIFDWSLFGVTVPNSVAYLARKEKRQKEEELARQKEEELAATSSLLSSVMSEASANQDGWEAAKEEIVDLKNQLISSKKENICLEKELISSKKENKSLEMELQMVQRQLSSTVFELLKTTKIMERVAELEEQFSASKRECEDIKGKVETMEDRVSSVETNLELTATMHVSTKKIDEKIDFKKEDDFTFI